MLILIAGATGNIGQRLITSLLSRGHQVRALARNPSKLKETSICRLESFIQSTSYYDVAALDRACTGVDGIICAYTGLPELLLDAQLLLLRAAERAGVKKYVASTWNYDWSHMTLGQQDSYDPLISFYNQVDLTSDIRPIYIFCGVLAEVMFGYHGVWTAQNHGVWDPDQKKMKVWGTGEEWWYWTTERDAAEFAANIIQHPYAASGGFWNVCSGVNTLKEVAAIYGKVRGTKVEVEILGTVSELRENAIEARVHGNRRYFWEYIGWWYHLNTVDGIWSLERYRGLRNKELEIRKTSMEEFLKENPEI